MDKIEFRKIGSLRLHPDNVAIFGHPTDEPNYEDIREDIKRRGLQEPIIILADGTILSGHIRYASVCWVLSEKGLNFAQIQDEKIAVRIHADFASKEEELEYLMDANDKRRQLDPRRIALIFERVLQVIEVNTVWKKGKKNEAVQALADRLGTSHKMAKAYCTIFGSKIVPDEVKDKVNSRDLSPLVVIEALKFAEESAKREKRAPSIIDVDVYLKHPKASKPSLVDTVRQMASNPALPIASINPPDKPPVGSPPRSEPVRTSPPPPSEPVRISPPAPQPPASEPIRTQPIEPVENEIASEPLNTIPEPQRLEFDAGDMGVDAEDQLPYPESDKISDVRALLKEALRTVVLDDSVISNLRGLHIELTSYLLAMGLIEPPKQLNIPSSPIAQIELCTSILQGLDGSSEPQSVCASLLDLMNFARITIESLTRNYVAITKTDSNNSGAVAVEPSNESDPLETMAETLSQVAPEIKPAPAPPTSQVMQASKPVTKDEESDLVTSVIDDFLEEINRAGVAISA